MISPTRVAISKEQMTDEDVVTKVLQGETALFEIVMRRHNQRLYRVARAILRNEDEAEDVMQDAYVRAYEHLHQFAGRAKFSTWLTRIAVHEALARRQRSNRYQALEPVSEGMGEPMDGFASGSPNPEQQYKNASIRVRSCSTASSNKVRISSFDACCSGFGDPDANPSIGSPIPSDTGFHAWYRLLRWRLARASCTAIRVSHVENLARPANWCRCS